MIKAIAIDDEPPALNVIRTLCKSHPEVELIQTFTSTDAATAFLQEHTVELAFIDIQMPRMSGLQFVALLPYPLMIIFTTAYSEYAVEGFNLNAIDYLLKPVTPERFAQALQKADEYYRYVKTGKEQDFIFIKADYTVRKIFLSEISLVEGLDDYIKIYLKNSRPLVVRATLKSMADKLPSHQFMRVHRSFIIALASVSAFRNKTLYLGDIIVPVGTTYEEDFMSAFKKMRGG